MTEEQRAALEEVRRIDAIVAEFDDEPGVKWDARLRDGAQVRHERRCHALAFSGRRCRKLSCPGRRYCKHHGGRRPLTPSGKTGHGMPSRYTKNLMPSLAQRLEQFLNGEDRERQLELYEEIALARAFLADQLGFASKLMAEESAKLEHKLAAAEIVRKAVDHVADLVAKMSTIEKNSADRVGVQQLGLFLDEVTRVIYKRLGDTEVADQIALDLRERVRLPDDPHFDPHVKINVVFDE